MRSIVFTLSDELDAELRLFLMNQADSPDFETIMEDALREYLSLRNRFGDIEFRMPRKQPLVITPVDIGEGPTDVSINHDAYFADDEIASWRREEPSPDQSGR